MTAQIITPYFGATVVGKQRNTIVQEMSLHLIAGKVDLDDDREIIECLYDAPERYGWNVIKVHLDDAIMVARQHHVAVQMMRPQAAE